MTSTTVTIVGLHDTHTVEGREIAPGLAITPAYYSGFYALTHTRSGHALVRMLCAGHIRPAAVAAAGSRIDWTGDLDTVREAVLACGLDRVIDLATAACSTDCDCVDGCECVPEPCHLAEVSGRA